MALGLCPALAVTTRVVNGLGIGAALTFVLVSSNVIIALLRDVIPERGRLTSYIAVIASLVTVVDLTMQAYTPRLSEQLGIYVPLLAVNCLILGRSQAFARRSEGGHTVLDSLGIGLGFTVSLTVISLVREVLGAGSITLFPMGNFSGIVKIPVLSDSPARIMVLAAGAFLVTGYLKALFNWTRMHQPRSAQPSQERAV